MAITEHPNYGVYIKESHALSAEVSVRMKEIVDTMGDSEEGIVMAKELHLEEARRRKELQLKHGMIEE